MASSNRHWPSLFKSKPCNTHHHQWQHDINSSSLLSAAGLQKNPYTSAAAAAVSEERTPEPKPRWNPKPEQIRILEAIFNSGMVNPPRDEIRRIRAQLQEYGQVGDANVFYWFQNRKSRSKHKQRHLLSARGHVRSAPPPPPPPPAATSSSSDRSIGSEKPCPPVSAMPASSYLSTGLISSSPVTQTYFHEPLIFQCPQGYCLSSSGDLIGFLSSGDQGIGVSSAGLYNELNVLGGDGWKDEMDHHHGSTSSAAAATTVTASIPTPPSAAGETRVAVTGSSNIACPVSEIQGMVHGGGAAAASRWIVFINGVAFESGGPLNVREAFWEEAVLLDSSGHPVLVDEWGVTVHPLQHGASYFLV